MVVAATRGAPAVLFPDIVFVLPPFQISAFGLAHRVINNMRDARVPEAAIENYKERVRGLSLEDTLIVTMYTVAVA